MEICINDQPVNFTLEDEKTLGHIVNNVRSWLNEQGYILLSLQESKKDLPYPLTAEIRDKPIEELTRINFFVKPAVEMTFEKFQTLHQYMTLLSKAVAKENLALVKELLQDFGIISEQLDQLFKPSQESQKNSDVLFLSSLLTQSGLMEGKIENRELAEKARTITEGFSSILEERLIEYSDPVTELSRTGKSLGSSIPKLSDVPVLLQTGKDAEAMHIIIEFTEISQKLLRLYPILKFSQGLELSKPLSGGQSLEQFYQDFNEILRELDNAFQEKDSVLIGDLLEYEIAPRIENLSRMTEELKG